MKLTELQKKAQNFATVSLAHIDWAIFRDVFLKHINEHESGKRVKRHTIEIDNQLRWALALIVFTYFSLSLTRLTKSIVGKQKIRRKKYNQKLSQKAARQHVRSLSFSWYFLMREMIVESSVAKWCVNMREREFHECKLIAFLCNLTTSVNLFGSLKR